MDCVRQSKTLSRIHTHVIDSRPLMNIQVLSNENYQNERRFKNET